MTDDPYIDGWRAVRDTFQRALKDNQSILDTPGLAKHTQRRTRGIVDALIRAEKVVSSDIDRQTHPQEDLDG
jgi:hypothetical protein